MIFLKKRAVLLLACLFFLQCTKNKEVYYEILKLNGAWNTNNKLEFNFENTNTIQKNIYILIRNNKKYPFSNLYLITTLEFKSGKIICDTLEYKMSDKNGDWLGKGLSNIKESVLWYKEKTFLEKGLVKIKIEHAVRKNGFVNGLEELKGIEEVGLIVEVSKQ